MFPSSLSFLTPAAAEGTSVQRGVSLGTLTAMSSLSASGLQGAGAWAAAATEAAAPHSRTGRAPGCRSAAARPGDEQHADAPGSGTARSGLQGHEGLGAQRWAKKRVGCTPNFSLLTEEVISSREEKKDEIRMCGGHLLRSLK